MSIKETRAILALMRSASGPSAAGPSVLATLVHAEGSSYRRVGARLLLTADGRSAGSISGGCLEDDVRERARRVRESGRPETVMYDTTGENDLVWGVGLGCHGVVRVLLERLSAIPPWADTLEANLAALRPTALAAVWGGCDAALWGTRAVAGTGGPDEREAAPVPLEDPAVGALLPPPPDPLPPGGLVFRQTVRAPVRLVVCGAGDDAIPLTRFGRELGWHVTVCDPRAAYATRERFPAADAVVAAGTGEIARLALAGDPTAVVVMTHHYHFDLPLLRELLPRPLAYLGLLGPRKRAERILDDLEKAGLALTPDQRARLHAPVGLDLGSDNPEEVALSIAAEIRAVLEGRDGRPLRERALPIHG
jgi:xanthine/CO dehydrogenase XdhC/CoxF family maturation factor